MNPPQEPQKRFSTPEEDHWRTYRWSTQQKSPERLEDAAKFLATMISLSFSILLGLGKSAFEAEDDPSLNIVQFTLGCWLLAALLAFWVLLPRRYFFTQNSIKAFQEKHRAIVRYKHGLLVASVTCFLVGMVILFVRFVIE